MGKIMVVGTGVGIKGITERLLATDDKGNLNMLVAQEITDPVQERSAMLLINLGNI